MATFETQFGPKLTVLDTDTITVAEIDELIKTEREVTRPADQVFMIRDKANTHYFAVNNTFTGLPRHTDVVILIKKPADVEPLKQAQEKKAKEVAEKAAREEGQSYGKRDFLRGIEKKIQQRWEESKIFEQDVPVDTTEPKYMATFPYPYMNGRLHLGHSFTITKADFAVAYHQLKGKRTLFPFGFHCTGMPIKACADKLKREIETYGNPPQFPPEPDTANISVYLHEENKPKKKGEAKSKKSKAVAKSGKAAYQWNIIRSSGVPDKEIADFSDAAHWLEYFPPRTVLDLKAMGAHVDWRRSFITTDVNPYYDAFVRWQFLRLRDGKKIDFGERYTIFSPKDKGPCMDHDRQTGEGVLPQDYTLVKQEVLQPFPKALASLATSGKKVYLVPATMRPETMYGQTNCWVLPDGDYGAFEMNDKEIFICTERSVRNMSYQKLTTKAGEFKTLLKFKGKDIIGAAIKAPLTSLPKIYVLPMFSINTAKSTGVVTSVPSDSPDDFAALRDIKTKKQTQDTFGITPEMLPEVIEIIDVPGYGRRIAETLVEELKIKSQNDRKQLDIAKETAYQKGFYEGVLTVGPHSGTKVEKAKNKIRDELIAAGLALPYSEPASPVSSRSGDDCVVALVPQWYLTYGEDEWRALGEKCLAQLNTFSDEIRHTFKHSFDWMKQWACSRLYGLGTKMPWDTIYLIDSLSDSTIYMAYYTIAHFLHSDLNGHQMGKGQIKASSMTPEVFDFIFQGKAIPANTDIPHDKLKAMRAEFLYWYPVDLRVSGKDLVPNHLLFYIYNHVAFFPPEQWPKGIRANGHVLLNGEKMSKSTGNFLTLTDAIDKFSADGMRFALADAGDTCEDANFTDSTANSAILRLYAQIEWIQEVVKEAEDKNIYVDQEPTTLNDLVFLNQIKLHMGVADKAYEKLNFKDALKAGFFDMQLARDAYVKAVKAQNQKLNKKLILDFIRYQTIALAPVCSHICEYVWTDILKAGPSVTKARWPELGEADLSVLKKQDYLVDLLHTMRVKIQILTKKKGAAKPTKLTLSVASNYPAWRIRATEVFKKAVQAKKAISAKDEAIALVKGDELLNKHFANAMAYYSSIKEEYPARGDSIFILEVPFNELEFLKSLKDYIKAELEITEVTIEEQGATGQATPLKPNILFA